MNAELVKYNPNKDKLEIYLYLLTDHKNNNALYYLTKEDITNIMRCSKYIYSFISDNNLLLHNLVKNNKSQ